MFLACFCCLRFDKAHKLVFSAFIVSYNEESTVYHIAWVAKSMEIQRERCMLTAVSFYKRLKTKRSDVGCRLLGVAVVSPVVEHNLHFWDNSRQERICTRPAAVP